MIIAKWNLTAELSRGDDFNLVFMFLSVLVVMEKERYFYQNAPNAVMSLFEKVSFSFCPKRKNFGKIVFCFYFILPKKKKKEYIWKNYWNFVKNKIFDENIYTLEKDQFLQIFCQFLRTNFVSKRYIKNKDLIKKGTLTLDIINKYLLLCRNFKKRMENYINLKIKTFSKYLLSE